MKIFEGSILIEDDRIKSINPPNSEIPSSCEIIDLKGKFVSPGFIESHLHIESSMMPPLQFCSIAVQHGTTTMAVDPHEITNVAGKKAIKVWIEQAKLVPLDMYIGIPSCVPATHMEHSGATITPEDIKELILDDYVYGLGEMMNFPGIIYNIGDARDKVEIAYQAEKLIDGHCPGVRGEELEKYISNGHLDEKVRIMNDHESTSADEVIEKLNKGMFIALRYGSATQDLNNILPELIKKNINLDHCSLCSDDLAPSDLLKDGHIDRIIRRTAQLFQKHAGDDLNTATIKAIRLATFNAGNYLQKFLSLTNRPPIGRIKPSFSANLIILDNLSEVSVYSVFHRGKLVFERGKIVPKITSYNYGSLLKSMNLSKSLSAKDFRIPYTGFENSIKVHTIGVTPISLITKHLIEELPVKKKEEKMFIEPDLSRDILKIAVFERHHGTGNHGIGFIKGIGIKDGAIASTVAHDNHNLIIVGTSDELMADLGNFLREKGGGMAILYKNKYTYLPLQIGGLMSTETIEEIVSKYNAIKEVARKMGCSEQNIFMTLSFMALAVIPALKITDIGLVDVEAFKLIDLIVK